MEFGFDPDAFWRQTPRLVVAAFEAKAKAAENEIRRAKWASWSQANLMRFAYHAPNKMPTLAAVLGESQGRQSGEQRRSMMKAFIAAKGGQISKRGRP